MRHAPECFCALRRKRNLPKIGIRGRKFERHYALPITLRTQGNNFALHFLSAVFIDDQKCLSNNHRGIQYRHASVAAHREGTRLKFEFLVVLRMALDGQVRKNCDSGSSAAFYTAKVKG